MTIVFSGVMKAVWEDSVSAAATMWPLRTWIEPAVKTTARTPAATTETVCVARVSARRGRTQRRGTAASSASVTTLTATARGTSCVEVSVTALQRI